MAYDLASRLLSRNYFAAGSGIAESTDSFTYDLASRPVTANNADALISYAYDSIGRRSSLTQTVDGLAKTVGFAYDSANRLLSRSPEGLAMESRSFTNRGQLAQVKLDSQVVATFDYDAIGRETSRTYGNGLNTTSGYTRADNLITSSTVANKPELSFNYSYDSNKNVSAEQRGGSMALYSWNATFDAMDRLNSQNDGVQTRSWNLDLVGNTTSETLDGNAEARTLNDMHAPTAAGNKAYTYDSNGQMTSKPGYTLVWDARNHLIRSTDTSNTSAPTDCVYRYDAMGNRVSKDSTRYLLVDNQVVAEFTGAASKQYCYGSYIDEVLAEKVVTPSLPSYYHRNRQCNTVALTDATGAVIEQYSTDAMGRVKTFDAAAVGKATPTSTTVLFTGRVFDAETGLYYFRARYFEPDLGVFVSRDPLGFVDGASVYQGWFLMKYATDPLGLSNNLGMFSLSFEDVYGTSERDGKIYNELKTDHFSVELNPRGNIIAEFLRANTIFQMPGCDSLATPDKSYLVALMEHLNVLNNKTDMAGGSIQVGGTRTSIYLTMSGYTNRDGIEYDQFLQLSAGAVRDIVLSNCCCESGKFLVIEYAYASISYLFANPWNSGHSTPGSEAHSGGVGASTTANTRNAINAVHREVSVPIGGVQKISQLGVGLGWGHRNYHGKIISGVATAGINVKCKNGN